MARLPPPMTMITSSIPEALASSTPYWIVGLSRSGSISFGCALVTGRNRVPRPAAVMIALRTGLAVIEANLAPGPGRRSAALLGQMKGELLEARVVDHHPRRRPLAVPGPHPGTLAIREVIQIVAHEPILRQALARIQRFAAPSWIAGFGQY